MKQTLGLASSPRPNTRLYDLAPSSDLDGPGPLCLWDLERQAGGLEPGELALHRTPTPSIVKGTLTVMCWSTLGLLALAVLGAVLR